MIRSRAMPKRAKGKQYPVEISAVTSARFLGYGSMLRSVNFDPSRGEAHAAVERLRHFQRLASAVAKGHIQAMIVNDGVAFVRELSPRSRSVSYDFLMRTYAGFTQINRSIKLCIRCSDDNSCRTASANAWRRATETAHLRQQFSAGLDPSVYQLTKLFARPSVVDDSRFCRGCKRISLLRKRT